MVWHKRLRRDLRGLAIICGLVLLGLLPLRPACWLGRLGGMVAYLLLPAHRRRAKEHIQIAFPQLSARERSRLARRSFAHLGWCAAECAKWRSIQRRIEQYVELPQESRRLLLEALSEGRGVMLVSGHVGNWELLGQRLAREAAVTVVARELNTSVLNYAAQQFRNRNGLRTLWRGSPTVLREMLRVFRDNGMLGLLIDQDTKVRSVFVPFFGRPASTPGAAGDLVARTGAPLLAPFIHRRADGRHVIQIRRLTITPTGDAEQDSRLFTAAATQAIEQAIRQNPEQWVWLHRRWRTQPDGQSNDAKVPIQPDRE